MASSTGASESWTELDIGWERYDRTVQRRAPNVVPAAFTDPILPPPAA